MADIKRKAIDVTGEITSSENGERRITFVASSNGIDRHYERVDVKSLRLPLKAGGYVTVADIPESGVEGVDVPLMLNHSADVTDVIGSVRKAFFRNGELVFEAGISSREIAQEVLTLIEEDHLSNAFSITMIDFDYKEDTIYNAEVIEVSVVYRGSNKEARLLSIKSLLGGEMPSEEIAKAEPETVEPVVEETTEETVEEVAEPVEAQAEAEETVEETTEAEAEPVAEEATEEVEAETNEETNKEETMENEIAKEVIATPAVKSC